MDENLTLTYKSWIFMKLRRKEGVKNKEQQQIFIVICCEVFPYPVVLLNSTNTRPMQIMFIIVNLQVKVSIQALNHFLFKVD